MRSFSFNLGCCRATSCATDAIVLNFILSVCGREFDIEISRGNGSLLFCLSESQVEGSLARLESGGFIERIGEIRPRIFRPTENAFRVSALENEGVLKLVPRTTAVRTETVTVSQETEKVKPVSTQTVAVSVETVAAESSPPHTPPLKRRDKKEEYIYLNRNFLPRPSTIEYARRYPDIDPYAELPLFKDYYLNGRGKETQSSDWENMFCRWLDKANTFKLQSLKQAEQNKVLFGGKKADGKLPIVW